MSRRVDVFAWVAVGVAVVAGTGLAAHRAFVSPRGRLIVHSERAPWIAVDAPFSARRQQWGSDRAPCVRFEREFAVAEVPSRAVLRVRAFGEPRVFLAGVPVSLDAPPSSWRTFAEVEVSPWLVRGSNTLAVEVRNRKGPALVSARLEAGDLVVASGPDWRVWVDGDARGRAVLARDVRAHPDSRLGPDTVEGLADRWPALAAIFVVSAGAFLARRTGRSPGAPLLPPAGVLLGFIAVAWSVLFVTTFAYVHPWWGFDSRHHLLYVERILAEGRLPLATDGWSTYHPPLFYLLGAAAVAVGRPLGEAVLFLKAVAFLSGLGIVVSTLRLAREVFERDTRAVLLATAFAGFVPMNLYMSAYVSNESLHAAITAAAALAACVALREREPSTAVVASVSAAIGLGLLTKYTAVVPAVVTAAFLTVKILVAFRGRPRVVAARLAALALPAVAVSGWFYARNVAVFGRPMVPNWDLPGPGRTWWLPPGFHTTDYYLSFGESLVRPYFSAFASFWDALYSTLWGDGMLGGSASWLGRTATWDYSWMAAGYVLAAPLTLMMVFGFARALRRTVTAETGGRRAAIGYLLVLGSALGFAVFFQTLSLPYFGQAKAFYALAATPVLAVCFALGYRGLDGRLATDSPARAVLFAWTVTALAAFYLSYADF